MFAYPWCSSRSGKGHRRQDDPKLKNTDQTASNGTSPLPSAVQSIYKLNQQLASRTKHHLNELDRKRRQRGLTAPTVRSLPSNEDDDDHYFHVTLLNKMKMGPRRLKDESMYGTNKCSVSWHADSLLEHLFHRWRLSDAGGTTRWSSWNGWLR